MGRYTQTTIEAESGVSSVARSEVMAKVFTIPVRPKAANRRTRERRHDPRYMEGQQLLVDAMKYLAQSDPVANRGAIELLSEHFRTQFRMSDSPLDESQPSAD